MISAGSERNPTAFGETFPESIHLLNIKSGNLEEKNWNLRLKSHVSESVNQEVIAG